MADLFGTTLSLGPIANLAQATIAAVAAPVAVAQAAVRTQPLAYLDETGWCAGRPRAWGTVFTVRLSRGATVAQDLLGVRFCGILVTDRWSAYTWYPTRWRPSCARIPAARRLPSALASGSEGSTATASGSFGTLRI